MRKEEIVLNQRELNRFLTAFDVIRHKYAYWMTDAELQDPDCQALLMKIGKGVHGKQTISRRQHYSNADIYLSVKKIYHEEGLRQIDTIRLTTEKFLHQYVDIAGLEQLFDARYFEYEWGMHLEYQTEKHEYSNYRDHYFHQIRNMYEMFCFLDDFGFEALCRKIYTESHNIYASYINDAIKLQGKKLPLEDSIYDEILKLRQTSPRNYQGGKEDLMEEMFFHQIIYSATIIAALAHDIGYPIQHISRIGERLKDFLPLSYKFYKIHSDFTGLRDDLADSLLLEVADFDELTGKIREDNYDHGVVSAVILLLYFYKNGYIFSLQPIKRAAVELAAVMIYKHTLKYDFQEVTERERAKAGKRKWYQNVYREDPLSYLFRLCDDIQEWERIYFQVSDGHNFFLCPKCRAPITNDSTEILESEYIEEHKRKEEEKEDGQENDFYSCLCMENAGENQTAFDYSRLLRVKIADEISIYKINGDNPEIFNSLAIHIHYDLFKMLQLSAYNPQFLAKRSEEMKKIKRGLYNQMLMPQMYLDVFVSANPVLIKLEILDRFLQKAFSTEYSERQARIEKIVEEQYNIEDQIIKIVNITKGNNYANIIMKQKSIQDNDKTKKLFGQGWNYLGNSARRLKFYEILLSIAKLFRILWLHNINSDGRKENMDNKLMEGMRYICENDLLSPFNIQTELMRNLLTDCLKQYMKHISVGEIAGSNNRIDKYVEYENMYAESDFMINQIKQYTKNRLYKKMKKQIWSEKKSGILDFHSDLYVFMRMNDYVDLPSL